MTKFEPNPDAASNWGLIGKTESGQTILADWQGTYKKFREWVEANEKQPVLIYRHSVLVLRNQEFINASIAYPDWSVIKPTDGNVSDLIELVILEGKYILSETNDFSMYARFISDIQNWVYRVQTEDSVPEVFLYRIKNGKLETKLDDRWPLATDDYLIGVIV